MRYSYSALVLATFTVSQVLAGPVNHAHQHLHKKHDEVLEVKAQEKRDWMGINFATVDITYSKGQTWGEPTKAVAAAPAPAATTTAAAAPKATPAKAVASPVKSSASAGIDSTTSKIQSEILSSGAVSKLAAMGAQTGTNAVSDTAAIWVGDSGKWTAEMSNESDDDIVLICWAGPTSWINANKPLITHSLDAGSSLTLSFADGTSGGCCGAYSDTELVMGQCSNTWMEFTFGSYATYDVSREVNMKGHSLSLVSPDCTSDMEKCSFQCGNGEDTCTFGYELLNCEPGSQPGANYGLDNGAPSGGCALGSHTHVSATFS